MSESQVTGGVDVRRHHLILALIQLVLAGLSIVESFKFAYWDKLTGPGAAFIPFWLGVFWIPIAAILVWQSRRVPRADADPIPRGTEGRRLLWFVLLISGLLGLFTFVGALLTIAAFVASALVLFEAYTWRKAAVTGGIISVAFYLLFRTWLGVALPKGLLFFL